MKKLIGSTVLSGLVSAVWMMCTADFAKAVTLTLEPSVSELLVNSTFSADLVVSDLGQLMAPSVSSFDVDINFDPSILSFDDISFGNSLDLGIDRASIKNVDALTAGTVNLVEVSLWPSNYITFTQASRIKLATLSFDTVGSGNSFLSLSPKVPILGDVVGNRLFIDTVFGTSVQIKEPPVSASVPENAVSAWVYLVLLAGGLSFCSSQKKTLTAH